MGYTHYWTPKKVSEDKFKDFARTCKELYKNLPKTTDTAGGYHLDDQLEIRGWDGTGKPTFTLKEISFNGNSERNLDHETFRIAFNEFEWSFCKTERKPYDLLVCACLIAARDIMGWEVRSDGNIFGWKPAIEFYLDTIYDFKGETPTEDQMKAILPEFLFDEQKGSQWQEPYNLMEELFGNNNVQNDVVEDEIRDVKIKAEVMYQLDQLYSKIGIDKPSNHDEIVEFITEDVSVSADPVQWNSNDITIAFRRYMESK